MGMAELLLVFKIAGIGDFSWWWISGLYITTFILLILKNRCS